MPETQTGSTDEARLSFKNLMIAVHSMIVILAGNRGVIHNILRLSMAYFVYKNP